MGEIDAFGQAAAHFRAARLVHAPHLVPTRGKLTDEDLREAEESSKSLHAFLRASWHVIEPKPFVDNWHIGAICEVLEAVTRNEIQRLLINVPPRCTKSITASVMWPAWSWVPDPTLRFLFGSYVGDLAERDAAIARRLILSGWYRARWGHLFHLIADQQEKGYYENDRKGYRISTSVEGSATGFGGDVVVADDPNNAQKSESKAIKLAAAGWWLSTMATRGNQPGASRWVCIQQRVDVDDVSGATRDLGTYVELILPAEYVPSSHCFVQWTGADGQTRTVEDARSEDGEVLDARLTPAFLAQQKESLSQDYEAQYQQNPRRRGGTMFREEWFKVVELHEVPLEECDVVWFWDLAASKDRPGKAPDWTVGILLARHRATHARYVLRMVRLQDDPAAVEDVMFEAACSTTKSVPVRYEEEGGSSGKYATLLLSRKFDGFDFQGERSTGDKAFRARPISGQAKAGLWHLVRADWNRAFLKEFGEFPKGTNDDIVDATSGANKTLTDNERRAFRWSERHTVLSHAEMISYFLGRDAHPDDRFVPPVDNSGSSGWSIVRCHWADPASSRASVAIWLARPPAGTAHAHRVFVLGQLTLDANLAPSDQLRALEDYERPWKPAMRAALLPPEALDLQRVYARDHKRKVAIWGTDLRAGIAQVRDGLWLDRKREHPFVANLAGDQRLYLVVDPRQRKTPVDEKGLLDLRLAFDQYCLEDEGRPEPPGSTALRALLGAAQVWFGPSGRMTEAQRIDKKLPPGLRSENAPALDDPRRGDWDRTRTQHLELHRSPNLAKKRRKGVLTPY